MKFSKDKFKKNTPSYVKKLLSEHLDADNNSYLDQEATTSNVTVGS